MNCIFCKIINKEVSTNLIWENESFITFLDINPINPGHVLIVPKTHIGYVFDLAEPLYSDFFRAAKLLSAPLKKATDAKRIGVAIEGFGVDHLHLHLVPVNSCNELDPNRTCRALDEDLSAMAQKIRSCL